MANYKVNVGINYPPDGRSEPGDVIADSVLPSKSIKWLTEQGIIELVAGNSGNAPAGGDA